jgi:amino acid transporter
MLVFQSTIAILLLVGFESVTALGAEAIHPKRDIRRAILLALVIQGLFAYLFEYFAANYMVGSYSSAAASSAPIGDMARTIGNSMLGGTGLAFTVILAVTVMIALIGTTLACINCGVRITYAMGKDKEVPSLLGVLHGKFATPHWSILALVLASAIFGAYGVLNVDHLTQITLASNTGTFLLYGLTNLIALVAFFGRPGAQFFKHRLVPALGFLANLIMLLGVVYLSFKAGGSTSRDTVIALAMVAVWLAAGAIWFVVNTRRQRNPILVTEAPQLTEKDLMLHDGD